jgi:hypothetical protein
MKWAEQVARIVPMKNAYRIIVGEAEVKRLLGRSRRRCVDNIKMDPRKIEWDGIGWINFS